MASELQQNISIQRYSGEQLGQYIDALAALRIEVFHAFPYLYQGTLEYEAQYLKTYQQSERALVVIAKHGDKVIGAATGLPLSEECEAFQRPFIDREMPLDKLFYCAESVLLPEYRGRGIGVAFFDLRLAHARELGGFSHATFCAVQRPCDHPLKPAGYQGLEGFWRNRGFAPLEGATTEFAWQDIDQDKETNKTMQFWLKAL